MKKLLILCLCFLAGCAAPTFEAGQQAREQGNLPEAARIWTERAENGDGRALYALYRLYSATGVGFGSDDEADEALRKLAETFRQAPAQYLYARKFLQEGELLLGQQWMERSAGGGYEEAVEFLSEEGALLSRKIGLLKGSPQQQYQLGRELYFGNNGLGQDHREAAVWLRRAARRGHALAQSMLAYQYLKGEGVAEDAGKAYRWYQEAAMQGLASAQGSLGYLYGAGRGTRQDNIMAYAWSVLASENGYAPAESNKQIYLDRMSNAERLESLNEIRRLEVIIAPMATR
ncbi:MAG: tetratricopeptide repeat protein [Oleiphilaceae bacterium]|nr:tetratricopeptide repeat protein [Oleiphilaceae bacterium]